MFCTLRLAAKCYVSQEATQNLNKSRQTQANVLTQIKLQMHFLSSAIPVTVALIFQTGMTDSCAPQRGLSVCLCTMAITKLLRLSHLRLHTRRGLHWAVCSISTPRGYDGPGAFPHAFVFFAPVHGACKTHCLACPQSLTERLKEKDRSGSRQGQHSSKEMWLRIRPSYERPKCSLDWAP